MPNITIEFMSDHDTLSAAVQLQRNLELREEREDGLHECQECGQLVEYELHDVCNWRGAIRHWCTECRDRDARQCDRCGEWYEHDVEEVIDGGSTKHWCSDCRRAEHVNYCDRCDTYTTDSTFTVYVGNGDYQEWCEDCADDNTATCDCCGERVDECELVELDMHDGSTVYVCDHCRDEYYRECDRCGRYVHVDEAQYDDWSCYCPDCYSPLGEHIYSYHHTDGAWFWQDDMTGVRSWRMTDEDSERLYLGLELEVANADSRKDIADTIWDEFGESQFVCKRDSTLGRHGVEIVSQPMTPLFHLNSGCWERITEICREYGALSDMARDHSCGLHIHVSRRFFKHKDTVYRIDRLMHHFEPQLIKFSRRRDMYWCAIEHDWYVENCKDAVSRKAEWKSVSSRCRGHNVALNDANSATVEYRLWKGSLNPETIRATIELTAGMTIIADTMSDEMADGLTWTMFKMLVRYALEAANIPHDDLDAYLERRGL